jgi:hypothetical protein
VIRFFLMLISLLRASSHSRNISLIRRTTSSSVRVYIESKLNIVALPAGLDYVLISAMCPLQNLVADG